MKVTWRNQTAEDGLKSQTRFKRLGELTTVAAVLASSLFTGHQAYCADPITLPFIHAQRTGLVDRSGRTVLLKGCNLGDWLLIELWMFGGCIQTSDQAHLFAKLDERFGKARAAALMDLYRSSFITARDFDLIRSFGFNAVRLPFDYRLLQSDEAPYALKPDAFKWLDRAVDLSERSGTYIILDMHAAPGGQSDDQCTGESGTNHLWNNPVNQQRMVDLWQAIAARYRERSTVAGYDLMNEPYADHHMDVRGDLRKIMGDCYTAIRATGDQHVMFFPGALGASPEFYGDPHTAGWTNVGFTEHFYAGLFGDKVAFESHLKTLTHTFPARQKWLDRVQSPYYVGEFNPVLDAIGGPRVTRAYYDAFAEHGWAGTIWSYKLIKPTGGAATNTWYCVSNAEALPKLDLNSSSYEDFERFFSSLATVPLAPNQPLLEALTAANPEKLPLEPAPAGKTTDQPSLLKNGSFEDAGTQANLANGWTRDGIGFRRETGAAHSGNADLVYQGGPNAPKTSGIWQEVPATLGGRYHLSVFVSRDGDAKSQDDTMIEVRLEGMLDGHQVILNTTKAHAADVGTGEKWTRFAVDGTAIGTLIRAKIVVTRGKLSATAHTLKFDDADLRLVTDVN
jgi:endoglucanase